MKKSDDSTTTISANTNSPSSTRKRSASRSSSEKKRKRMEEVKRQRRMLLLGITCVILLAVLLTVRFVRHHGKGTLKGVNEDVLQYRSSVEAWCREYDIEEYATLMLAIMQQESSGQGTDVFQCSESPFNTLYDNYPGAISDVDYSIQVGAQTFAYCLQQAKCKSISDKKRLKIAIQEYNFGNDYAGWALENYGGYSPENAYEYSEMMKAQLGWDTYGDVEYVPHVLQYIDF